MIVLDVDTLLAGRSRRATSSVVRDLLALAGRPGMLSLAGGLPAPDLLPVDRLREAAADVLDAAAPDRLEALQYGPTEGLPRLRSLVAERYGADAGQVLVTTGSQQGLDLLARALVEPGDAVVVEAPSYLGALQAFRLADARLVGVPGDADGLRTDLLEDELRRGLRPKLVYVVPDLHNPSGATLSIERRLHLAGLAERHGLLLVEDDPYGALRFDGRRLPRVRELTEHAVTLGTASKTVAPGLRVAWTVAPPALVVPLTRVKQVADLHTGSLDQALVAEVLADDRFVHTHLARLRTAYGQRAHALVDAVRALPGTPLRLDDPAGGLFCWATLDEALPSADALLPLALDHEVAFVPGSAFAPDGRDAGHLRLSFATLDEGELEEAVARLGRAVVASADRRVAPASG